MDQAFEVSRGTQEAGMAADRVVFNILLDAGTQHNRVKLAD